MAVGAENTYVATDDQRIAEVVIQAGGQVVMTSPTARTGTDRLWDAAQQIKADVYVNVQGDEPLIDPVDINIVIQAKLEKMDCVINGIAPIGLGSDPESRSIPKVVTTETNFLVYMSRLPIPGSKSGEIKTGLYRKQVCVFAFSYEQLKAFGEFGRKGKLEEEEDLEMLRYLELSIPVYMVETSGENWAVDVPEDVIKVEQLMAKKQTIKILR